MKAACLQENLSRALATVAQAASRNRADIAHNALLTAERSGLTVYATDRAMSASIHIPAQVAEEGSAAIPARLIAELAAAMPQERADLESTHAPIGVNLQCGRQEANISGANPADYPPKPRIDPAPAWRIEPDEFRKALIHTLFATSRDPARPALGAVCMTASDARIEFAATDGFRLSIYAAPLSEPAHPPGSVLMPARALEIIARLLTAETNPARISLSADGRRALARLNAADITALQPEPGFPEHGALVPDRSATTITVNAAALRNAARSARLFESASAGSLRLQTPASSNGARALTISSDNDDAGYHTGAIDAVIEGPDAKIAIYSKYLIEALEPLGSENATLSLNDPTQPALVRAADNDAYRHVIMPVFVRWN